MGLIDHETLHRVMAEDPAAFADPSADLLGLKTDGDLVTAEGGDGVRSRNWGRPGQVRAENRQDRP